MKKNLFAISALALLTGISTSCHKEIDNLQESNQNSKFIVTATIADNDTKMSYMETSSKNLKPNWDEDDIIIGFDGDGNTYGYQVTSVVGTKATMAIITSGDYVGSKTTDPTDGTKMYMIYAPGKKPSDISSKSLTVSLANQSKDVIPALMMASATVSGSSLSLSFQNKTAIIAIKDPVMAAASTSYTSITLVGTGVNTEVKFDLDGSSNLQATYQTPGTITKAVEFTSEESKLVEGVTYIVACPITSSTNLKFVTNYLETFEKTGKTVATGNYYYMTAPTFTGGHTAGLLSGVFSVSPTTVVGFSRGNLQYQASTGTWQFAANQYDYIGNAAGNNTTTGRDTQSAWIDLFGWGATGHNSFGQKPYSINTTETDYKTVATAADGETLTIANKADWGYCMGGESSKWHTMSGGSSGEWKYLLSTRIVNGGTGEGKSYQRATINSDGTGVYGLIIYPDYYTAQTTATSYTSSQWTTMESAGCVFLPAAGGREGSTVEMAGTTGYYCSSTAYESNTTYFMGFNSTLFDPVVYFSRRSGYSVRLVSAVQ